MILIITQKSDIHADQAIYHLNKMGAKVIRLNAEDFPEKASMTVHAENQQMDGVIKLYGLHETKFSEIKSCWFRHTTWFGQDPRFGISKKLKTKQAIDFAITEKNAFLSSLWTYLSDSFWINYPPKIHMAEGKMTNLKIAREIGLEIPKTLITIDPQTVKTFYDTCNGKIIYKVLGATSLEKDGRDYAVYSNLVTKEDLKRINNVVYAPTQFQEYIPKKVELRVTIVGKKIFACEIHSQDSEKTKIDWRHYDFSNVKHTPHQLPHEIEKKLLKMHDRLDLNFGAFDLILTPEGRYVFLELNPNGQYLWIESLTKMPISLAIAELLTERK